MNQYNSEAGDTLPEDTTSGGDDGAGLSFPDGEVWSNQFPEMLGFETALENVLLHQSSREVLDWMQSVWSNPQEIPEGFNWLGVAGVAGTKANLNADLGWAEVAIRIYEWLAGRANDESIRHSELSSAMSLRASMINKRHQTIPGHIVLDSKSIVRWFYNELNVPYDEVVHKVENWRALQLDEIRAIRRIKNRLNTLKPLIAKGYIQPDKSLQTWLELYPELP